jgi:hypothetical protein
MGGDVAKDANMNITVVAKVMDLVNQQLTAKDACMPQNLILEIDNTCREGKNQHFEMFSNFLASTAVYESSQTETAEVGHTHNGQSCWRSPEPSTCAGGPRGIQGYNYESGGGSYEFVIQFRITSTI